MASVAYHVAGMLVEQGISPELGGASPWCVNVSGLPETPVNVLALEDTAGLAPLQYKLDIRRPGVQLIARGSDYLTTYAKVSEVYAFLGQQAQGTVVEGFRYIGFDAMSDIIYIRQDNKTFFLFSANFTVHRVAL